MEDGRAMDMCILQEMVVSQLGEPRTPMRYGDTEMKKDEVGERTAVVERRVGRVQERAWID